MLGGSLISLPISEIPNTSRIPYFLEVLVNKVELLLFCFNMVSEQEQSDQAIFFSGGNLRFLRLTVLFLM